MRCLFLSGDRNQSLVNTEELRAAVSSVREPFLMKKLHFKTVLHVCSVFGILPISISPKYGSLRAIKTCLYLCVLLTLYFKYALCSSAQ